MGSGPSNPAEEQAVVIRFDHDWDKTCMQMGKVLAFVAEMIKNFADLCLVDITEVPAFNTMYELYDPCKIMFFFRNKHIMIDLGTGNNNFNWALKDKQEFSEIVKTVYRGARKGQGLVHPPRITQPSTDIEVLLDSAPFAFRGTESLNHGLQLRMITGIASN